jgi:hypothetical protein
MGKKQNIFGRLRDCNEAHAIAALTRRTNTLVPCKNTLERNIGNALPSSETPLQRAECVATVLNA